MGESKARAVLVLIRTLEEIKVRVQIAKMNEVFTSLSNMHWFACQYYWSEKNMWCNPRKNEEYWKEWMKELNVDLETAGGLMVELNIPPKYIILASSSLANHTATSREVKVILTTKGGDDVWVAKRKGP